MLQLFYSLFELRRNIGIETIVFDLGIWLRLRQLVGEVDLVLVVKRLLRASSGVVDRVVVLLIGLRRGRVARHLRIHAVDWKVSISHRSA